MRMDMHDNAFTTIFNDDATESKQNSVCNAIRISSWNIKYWPLYSIFKSNRFFTKHTRQIEKKKTLVSIYSMIYFLSSAIYYETFENLDKYLDQNVLLILEIFQILTLFRVIICK